MKAPQNLKHKPILASNDYDKIDSKYAKDTDAKALSIGLAQYDSSEISAKVWRKPNGRWSRQSEELPIHRLLDLSILAISSFFKENIDYKITSLHEEITDSDNFQLLKEYYEANQKDLKPRILELKSIIEKFLNR